MSEAPAGASARRRIDPVTASVIQGALEHIAVEMGYKPMRMSSSSIIRESEDFGAALVDPACRQLCETRQSTPLQSGPIPGYVRGILRQLRDRGEDIDPGDVIMHNDAYGGASHGPDVAFCVPAFHGQALVGFSVTTAHHLDIGGLTRPITIVAPKGTLANPIFPAPTIARFCPGNQLADTVMKALAPVVPTQVSAGIGNLRVIAFSGLRGEQHWVHMEIFEGSYGGRHGADGMDAVDTLYANTRNNPIEDIESHLLLRVERYELREDACAAGQWRGGLGAIREFTYLVDGGASVEGDGHKFPPWGFAGGHPGYPAELIVKRQHGGEAPLPSKVPYTRARAGDRFLAIGPSGGGYGDPHQRDPRRVLDDVLDGHISIETAVRDYGVVITPAMEIDPEATARARSAVSSAPVVSEISPAVSE